MAYKLIKKISVGRCFVTIERDTLFSHEAGAGYEIYSSGHPRVSTGVEYALSMRTARHAAADQIRKLRKSPYCKERR